MNRWLRPMLGGIVTAFLFSALLLAITFAAFPLQNWSAFWKVYLFDFPFAVTVGVVIVSAGMAGGFLYHALWQGRIRQVNEQLDQLLKGQKLQADGVQPVPELASVHERILQLEAKLRKQTELSQRLATERAREREKSLQEVVVQERNRLARELHDSVSQQLFAASMMISAINESRQLDGLAVQPQLALVEKMIQQSQLEMRALLLHLRPVALRGRTLQEGMEELLRELRQKVPMQVQWKMEAFHLDKGVEDHLFRILQEAVSNTLRHAKARSLHVLLIKRDEYVIMRVVDDGIGFDVQDAEKLNSYGLQNMHERAMEIGGQVKIVSLRNQGTRIEVKIPFIHEEVGDIDSGVGGGRS